MDRLSRLAAHLRPAANSDGHLQAAGTAQHADITRMAAAVKIFVKEVAPQYDAPWARGTQRAKSGSGLPLPGRRILTNSHVIDHASSIRVRRHGRPGKYEARLLCQGRQCDLALLEVPDAAFWEGLEVPELNDELPALDANVTAVGYPIGGDNVCVTRGVVSRVDTMDYTFVESGEGDQELLVLQIDAAINPGNSGGPVFDERNTVVGVAFAGIGFADNVGFVIPVEVVRLFLASFERRGEFTALASLGVSTQGTENPALRAALGLAADSRDGLVITRVAPLSPLRDLVRERDVLLAIDGEPVAEDATVALRGSERVHFLHRVTRKMLGAETALALLREGRRVEVRAALRPTPLRVPRLDGVDAHPRYVIVGGLVFVPLSLPWIHARFRHRVPAELAVLLSQPRRREDEEVVVLSRVLAAAVNFGYQELGARQVSSINGIAVDSLRHLLELCEANTEPRIVVRLDKATEVVLDAAQCAESRDAVLAQHAIREWACV